MKQEKLEITNSRGQKLASVLHYPDTQARATWIILNHGMLSDKDSRKHVLIAERLCSLGYMVERHDFSGQGQSEGEASLITYSNEINDLECIMAELESRGAKRFLLVGSSMGSGISILTAGRRPERVAALVLMASITKTATIYDKMPQDKKDRWRETGYYPFGDRNISYDIVADGRTHDVPGSLAAFGGPVLFIHGTDDELISVHDIPILAARHEGEHKIVTVPGADHRFSDEAHRLYMADVIADWVATHAP
jgi:pimeloyl-ACP methyl ester carboxylesterase